MQPSIMLMPAMPLQLSLTSGQLRTVLEARGYHCMAASLSGVRSMLPGTSVVLQFGDLIAVNGRGAHCLTIRCSVQINGCCEMVSGVTRWQIHKAFPLTAEREASRVKIDADVIVAGGIPVADALADGDGICRHLQALTADAAETFQELLAADGTARTESAFPLMRIEARVFGELAAGRSGLLRQAKSSLGHGMPQHLQIMHAASDRLKSVVLPELADIVRGMALQGRGALHDTAATPERGISSRSLPPAARTVVQPIGEPAATLVPERDLSP